jgi:hypothetical protein
MRKNTRGGEAEQRDDLIEEDHRRSEVYRLALNMQPLLNKIPISQAQPYKG